MKDIENDFRLLADRVADDLPSLSAAEAITVTRFFILWTLRQCCHQNPILDPSINGVAGEPLTKDKQEGLEALSGAFIRPDQSMPARFLSGIEIQIQIDRASHQFQGMGWGIVRALQGDFICPDTFGHLPVVPVAPNLCLVSRLAGIPKLNLR